MISETQREVLTVLAELCELSDDIRLGQLVAWLGDLGEMQTGRTLANIDDDQLLPVLYQHRANLVARLSESQQQPFPVSGSSALMPPNPVAPGPEVGR